MLNKRSWVPFLIGILVVFLLLAACSQRQQQELATFTGSENSSPTSHILLLVTNTAKPPQITPTQTSTATLPPKSICPAPNSEITMPEAATASEMEQAILDYLNQGGSAERLQNELNQLNDKGILGPSQVIMVDINRDDIKEIVLAIIFGPALGSGSYLDVHGNLNIYSCGDGEYDATQIVAGESADTLRILTIENLLGSDTPEILISRRWTYLDSYYEFVELYILTEDGWVLSFQSPDSRCGIETELRNGSNGHKELVIIGKNHCPNDSDAPLPGTKLTYEFEDNEVKLIQEESVPPP